MLLGLALRFWGIGFGLPYTYAPDEPSYLLIALRIVQTGDLNPHWWYYPTFMFYLDAVALLLLSFAGRVAGVFATTADLVPPEVVAMGVGRIDLPAEFLVARGLTALFSAAAIAVVYLIGRRVHPNRWVAVLAALAFAVSPTIVEHSHRIGPDILAMFFLLVAFLCAMRLVDEPKMRHYIGVGVGAGLAIASKYNAGLILVALLVAHFARWGWSGWRRRELYLALAVAAITFAAAVPFAVLDFPNFWAGVRWQAFSYTTEGHVGQEGDALRWYVAYLFKTEGWLAVLGALCGVYFLFARSAARWVLISFPLVYFAFVSAMFTRNARTIMLIIPFLNLLAAMLLVGLGEWIIRKRPHARNLAVAAMLALCIGLVSQPLQTSVAENIRLTLPDGRESARQWLEANLPAGARVAVEAYSPYLDTRRFVVQGINAIVDRPLGWYEQNGFEYVVFSEGMYGRFYAEPERYSDWIARYDEFFKRFAPVARFDDNGYEIRVFKTGATLPAQRVAARFGDDGDLIELVGYDAPKWSAGELLRVKLVWRALRPANEPLELSLQLLDRGDREIGLLRGDLFQGNRSREGVFATEWVMSAADAAPSLYWLEVNVTQTRYGYRAPIANWAGDKIETLRLGPLKMFAAAPSASQLQAARAANARFGDQIVLLSYTLGAVNGRAGAVLPLTLDWQALGKPTRDYTIFIHLLDADGKVRAQSDAQPRGGAYPTSAWDAGEIVRDEYALSLPTDLAPGAYRVAVGLYEYPGMARLGVTDARGQSLGDHWLLPDLLPVTR